MTRYGSGKGGAVSGGIFFIGGGADFALKIQLNTQEASAQHEYTVMKLLRHPNLVGWKGYTS